MTSEVTQDSEFSALQDKFAAALEAELSQSYDCTRVWSAWGYGTMGEDDFHPVINRIDQIATELAKTALHHEAHRLAHSGGEVVALANDWDIECRHCSEHKGDWKADFALTIQRAFEEQTRPLRDALEWYAEQARLCRLIHSEGDAGRHELSADGGKRALAALKDKP